MKFEPLTARELRDVINGVSASSRIPAFFHFWTHPDAFDAVKRPQIETILNEFPQDAQILYFDIPYVHEGRADDPAYRWNYRDETETKRNFDNAGFIEDWDAELTPFLNDFPNPDYPGLVKGWAESDGRYRLGHWWYLLFERFWQVRGMENALIDFYENPDAVHALFRKLTDFYKRMIERGKLEGHLDGVLTSDDLGTQTGTFFSDAIFDEFFAPYYREIIEKAHSLDMHFWLHACGNIRSFIPKFIDLGVDVLHPIQKYTMDERKIAAEFGDRITVWAGFDVQRIIPYGSPEDVRREARYLIDTYARKDGRFMFTLGNAATGDMKPECFRALADELFTYGTEKLKSLKER